MADGYMKNVLSKNVWNELSPEERRRSSYYVDADPSIHGEAPEQSWLGGKWDDLVAANDEYNTEQYYREEDQLDDLYGVGNKVKGFWQGMGYKDEDGNIDPKKKGKVSPEQARFLYQGGKVIQGLVGKKGEQELDRLNLIAKNLGYSEHKPKKEMGVDDRLYAGYLANKYEEKQNRFDKLYNNLIEAKTNELNKEA